MTRSRSSVLLFGAFAVSAISTAATILTTNPAFAADKPAEPPQTQPAGNGGDVVANMRQAFAELADPRADVREAARFTLMGLERRDLDELWALVEHSRPLRPAQAAVLRQIVTHVYLSGETYDPEPRAGFLGVRAQQIAITSADDPVVAGAAGGAAEPGAVRAAPEETGGPAGGDGNNDNLIFPRVGMVVISRLPGFVAHRVLLDGDVILGIVERPKVSFVDRYAFTSAIKEIEAGETFHLNILRRGRVLKVALTLDRRPAIVNNDLAGDTFDRDRRAKADIYWRQSFGPLLPDTLD